MTAERAFDPALAPVLRVFDVEPVAITPVPSGQVNQHWRIETGDGELFLRRYNQFRRPDAVAFEHAALEHAARRGWPVATAKPSAAGEAVVSYGDGRFSLFPALPGAPRRDTTRAHQRIKGRLLARFHRDMAVFAPDRQRDGFGRLWELDPVVQAAGAASFNDLLSRFRPRALRPRRRRAPPALPESPGTCASWLRRSGAGRDPWRLPA